MKRLFALFLCAALVGTTILAVPAATPVAAAKTKAKKKKKKTPAKKKKKVTSYTYSGTGSITTIGDDDTTLTIDFTSANRTLAKAIGSPTGTANITVLDSTDFALDGEKDVDFFDLCTGDNAKVTIVTKKRLTSETLASVAAKSVVISSNNSDCEPPSIDQ